MQINIFHSIRATNFPRPFTLGVCRLTKHKKIAKKENWRNHNWKVQKKRVSSFCSLPFRQQISSLDPLFFSFFSKKHTSYFFFSFNHHFHIIKKYFIFFLSRSPVEPLFVRLFFVSLLTAQKECRMATKTTKKLRTGDERGKEHTQGVPKKSYARGHIHGLLLIRWKKYAGAVKVQRYAKAPENCYFSFFSSVFTDALTILIPPFPFSLSHLFFSRNTNYAYYTSTKWSVFWNIKDKLSASSSAEISGSFSIFLFIFLFGYPWK